MTAIRVECAWCLKNMGTKEFGEPESHNPLLVSHSICPTCYAKVIREIAVDARRITRNAAFRRNPFIASGLVTDGP
jgi:hypothetical protein